MRTARDVEAYLLRLNRPFRLAPAAGESGDATSGQAGGAASAGDLTSTDGPTSATYLLSSSPSMPPIALRVEPPLLVLRVHIGDLEAPEKGAGDPALLRRLLELNVRALVHASYGLDGAKILLSSALELENLDLNELEATLDEVDLALTEHVPMLAQLKQQGS
jgi:hypothetical protein